MITKVTMSHYRVEPRGWKQSLLIWVFCLTGQVNTYGDKLLTDDRRMIRWFK